MSYVTRRTEIDLDLDVDPLASEKEVASHVERALRELTAAPHMTIERVRFRRLSVDGRDVTELVAGAIE